MPCHHSSVCRVTRRSATERIGYDRFSKFHVLLLIPAKAEAGSSRRRGDAGLPSPPNLRPASPLLRTSSDHQRDPAIKGLQPPEHHAGKFHPNQECQATNNNSKSWRCAIMGVPCGFLRRCTTSQMTRSLGTSAYQGKPHVGPSGT